MSGRPGKSWLLTGIVIMIGCCLCLATAPSSVSAQLSDEQALGLFSLLEDQGVRESLELTEETEAELALWFNDRLEQADDLSAKIEALSPAEQMVKIREFTAESVAAGRSKLSADQNSTLDRWGVAANGISSLADDRLAEKVGLKDDQKASLKQLINKRDLEMSAVSGLQRDLIRRRYEVEMAKVLNNIQFSAWRVMSGDVTTAESLALTSQAAELSEATQTRLDDQGENTAEEPSLAPEKSASPSLAAREEPAVTEPMAIRSPRSIDEGDDIERPITFNFSKTEWEPVLRWFAEQGGFSLEMVDVPEGTFTYIDEEGKYSVAEALDQINHVLRAHGFTLVRNRRMLFLIDYSSDEIPEAIIETITPDELMSRGKYEVIRCIFELGTLSAEDLEDEIAPIIEDDEETGKFYAVPTANRMLIQTTGDNLRTIYGMIQAAREKTEVTIGEYVLKFTTPEEVMVVARPLLGIDQDEWADEDGNIRIAVTGFGSRFFFQGNPERMAQFQQICERIDTDPGGEDVSPDLPYLDSYAVSGDLETAFTVLQTQLAGVPDVRMSKDETKGALIIKGRAADHEVVKESLKLLDGSDVMVKVIPLRRLDAVDVVSQIRELWGGGVDAEGNSTPGPTVSTDISSNSIIVRDVPYRVEQIVAFVEQLDPSMGEGSGFARESVRHLQMTESEAKDAVDWIQTMWDVQGTGNKLRIVMPEDRKGRIDERTVVPLGSDRNLPETGQNTNSNQPSDGTMRRSPTLENPGRTEPNGRPESTDPINRFRSRENLNRDNPPSTQGNGAVDTVSTHSQEQLASRLVTFSNPVAQDEIRLTPSGQEGAEVIVRVTPYGLIIESEDLDALDAFEDLIYNRPFTEGDANRRVYYLKHRKAEEASELLKQVLGISGGGGGGAGGIINSFAENALGPGLGGIASNFLGGGGGGGDTATNITTIGSIDIFPDALLNSLVVTAVEEDHEQIEELLSYIDQPQAPQDPETTGRFHVIPVQYANATDLLSVITAQMSQYIRTEGNSGGGQNDAARAQQQILQQILGGGRRGGRGGGGGGGGSSVEIETPKMSVSADPTSNAILVTGPEFLYEQVQEIVSTLDQPSIVESQGFSLIELDDKVNPELIRTALQNAFGESIRTSTASNSSTNSGRTSGRTTPFQFNPGSIPSAGGFPTGGFPSGFRGGTFGGGRTSGTPSTRGGGTTRGGGGTTRGGGGGGGATRGRGGR